MKLKLVRLGRKCKEHYYSRTLQSKVIEMLNVTKSRTCELKRSQYLLFRNTELCTGSHLADSYSILPLPPASADSLFPQPNRNVTPSRPTRKLQPPSSENGLRLFNSPFPRALSPSHEPPFPPYDSYSESAEPRPAWPGRQP